MSVAERMRRIARFIRELRERRSRRLFAYFSLITVLAALGAWLVRGPAPHDLGDPFSWTDLESREKVAEALNRNVKIDGFSAFPYLVRRGENFWGIAVEHGVDIDTLIGCNPALESLNAWIDQSLLLVNKPGCLHLVRTGENLDAVARDYSIEPEKIRAANRISLLGIRAGQLLFIPGASPVHMLTPEMKEHYARRSLFRSPLSGGYSSLKGLRQDPISGSRRHHAGVDIRADRGDPVGAAAAGKVTFAGELGGYGKCVIMDHGNGYKTLYGHLSRIYVKSGQEVPQHHFIGRVGSTGRTTGPHLHFEIRRGKKVMDPLQYLW